MKRFVYRGDSGYGRPLTSLGPLFCKLFYSFLFLFGLRFWSLEVGDLFIYRGKNYISHYPNCTWPDLSQQPSDYR